MICHAGQKNTYDFARGDVYALHCAAFFTDCEHELRPIQAGYRLALIYNLIAKVGHRALRIGLARPFPVLLTTTGPCRCS